MYDMLHNMLCFTSEVNQISDEEKAIASVVRELISVADNKSEITNFTMDTMDINNFVNYITVD